jgi:hypothetical protein
MRTTPRSSGPRETNSGNSVGCKIPARISRLSTMRGPGRAKYALAFTTYTWPLRVATRRHENRRNPRHGHAVHLPRHHRSRWHESVSEMSSNHEFTRKDTNLVGNRLRTADTTPRNLRISLRPSCSSWWNPSAPLRNSRLDICAARMEKAGHKSRNRTSRPLQ